MHVAAEYCKLHRRVMSSTPGMGCDGGKQNEETTKADTPRGVCANKLLLCTATYELQCADA